MRSAALRRTAETVRGSGHRIRRTLFKRRALRGDNIHNCNNYTERMWVLVTMGQAIQDLMKTYVKYPPRKLQSESYTGPITISGYEKFQHIREALQKEGIRLPLPSGN